MFVLKQLGLFAVVHCCLQSSASLNHGGGLKVEGRGKVTHIPGRLWERHCCSLVLGSDLCCSSMPRWCSCAVLEGSNHLVT